MTWTRGGRCSPRWAWQSPLPPRRPPCPSAGSLGEVQAKEGGGPYLPLSGDAQRAPGKVSLLGGKAEEDDADDAATTTREVKEEIGLDPSLVTVIIVLVPFLSKDENQRWEERERMGAKFIIHYFNFETEDKKFTVWGFDCQDLVVLHQLFTNNHHASQCRILFTRFLDLSTEKVHC